MSASAPTLWVLGGVAALLTLASAMVWRRGDPNGEVALRVRSWWVMVAVRR